MSLKADMSIWQGETELEDKSLRRWRHCVKPLPDTQSLAGRNVLLGFACDEGVRRNGGRPGAIEGPASIRQALAKQAFHLAKPVYEAGDINCRGRDLETAQAHLGAEVSQILFRGGSPVLIGGGHEIAWGCHQGLREHLGEAASALGIINLDAHFDLRDPAAGGNSGTPFRQIAEWCETHGTPFHYLVLGINPAANTKALFDYARLRDVRWIEDRFCTEARFPALQEAIHEFVASLDCLYLTVCLDAFCASQAPGVSAPGVPGISPAIGIALIHFIKRACAAANTRLLLMDIAEMNPRYDRDDITARLAARLIHEYLVPAACDSQFSF